ncbi:MAG TPA: type II secretion system F family protein [Terriglobia bacterium]|nr:type II secretion system F family protein [Terriglobia bacterium]
MPEFSYRAVKNSGELVQGTLVAETEPALLEQLRRMGCLPIHVSAKDSAVGAPWLRLTRRGPSTQDRLVFARQLATLVRAGIPLDRSLSLCRDLAEKPALRAVIDDTLRELRSGQSLAHSLAANQRFFPPLYVAMVRAGEASGTLPAVLDRLVEFEEFSAELRGYLISALIYPMVLLAVGGVAIAFLLGFVVPRFAQIFEEAGKELPLPTQVLMDVSEAFRNYGWLAALIIVAAVLLVGRWVRSESGRLRWDQLRLRAPLLGDVSLKLEIARFAKTMGTLLAQAVPIISALRLTREVLSNRRVASAVEPLIQGVKRGQGLARPLAETGLFPALAVQLMTLGEQTGKLDSMLLELAAIYDREVRVATKRLVALVEPAVILAMGLVVGTIVISTLLAIVSINEVPF